MMLAVPERAGTPPSTAVRTVRVKAQIRGDICYHGAHWNFLRDGVSCHSRGETPYRGEDDKTELPSSPRIHCRAHGNAFTVFHKKYSSVFQNEPRLAGIWILKNIQQSIAIAPCRGSRPLIRFS
ncbi:hypothetical protein QQF64_002429 [Cirrhinus molitorella]|uniref:Uncharacterized protein n=1 Tax=Cirrhinus molitorella TaxID=172907 RepID=A0ABR3MQ58_9TELE